jgi:orotate phosphoribosyltransferase
LAIDRVIALIDREEENGRQNIEAHVGRVEALLTRTEIMARYRGTGIGALHTVKE